MTKLTKSVQNCGLHDCTHHCFAVTEKEARKAIEEVKKACIEAINTMDLNGINIVNNNAMTGIKLSIKAIQSVK